MKIQIMAILFLFILLTGCTKVEYQIQPSSEVYPTFFIKPGVDTSFNSHVTYQNGSFIVPAVSWKDAKTIMDASNNFWCDPRLEFVLGLIPRTGGKASDHETIYFSILGLDQRIEDYRLITKSGGWYRANWSSGSDIWYERGQKSLSPLSSYTLMLDFNINRIGMSHLNPYEGITMQIIFCNYDNSWSRSFNVTFMVIREY